MATTTAEPPILNLSTIAKRPFVLIDDMPYDLALPDTLSLLEYRHLATLLPRLEALWMRAKAGTITKAEDLELSTAFKRVCATVLKAPESVLSKLSDIQRVAIYGSFLQLPSATLLRVGAMMQAGRQTTPSNQTGATSSHDSRGRTAALRTTGRQKSRSTSSDQV